MGRAPCCEKMGVKRGTWTPEEDQILVAYIQRYGHGNWRALPKQAGLLRCGKSCRLRWTNYLRPDIKRGNFSREEEETIIKLHELLGNRWSAIAARLPGRTDNEIKNVWHTHLKKRLKQNEASPYIKRSSSINVSIQQESIDCAQYVPVSPHQSSTITDISSSSTDFSTLTAANCTTAMKDEDDPLADIAESLWEVLSSQQDQARMMDQFQANMELEFPPYNDDNMDFWLNLYFHEERLPELLEF